MCGRFALTFKSLKELRKHFGLDNIIEDLPPHYNIAPTQNSLVITEGSGKKNGTLMQWGLVPAGAKDASIGHKMINARAETLAEKPSFKTPLQRTRCLVPASGFYEWRTEGKLKQPYFLKLQDRELFAFAGLYDTWRDAAGRELRTFTIITTAANQFAQSYHDRMPVILRPEQEALWLDPALDLAQVTALLRSDPKLTAYKVSPAVNKPDIDRPELIKPL